MKFILSSFALLFIIHTSAQTLTLYGKVEYFGPADHGPIFYSTNGEAFSKQKYITYDQNGSYSFSITLADVNKKAITSIAFGLALNSDLASSDACVHRVNISTILQDPKFRNSPSIRVHTDLMTSSNCEAAEYSNAGEDGNEGLTGYYHMQRQDTIWELHLKPELYNCTATFGPESEDRMNKMTGNWQYNKETRKLSLIFYEQWNEKFGIGLSVTRRFDFDVTENKGKFSFSSDNYKLSR